MKDFSQSPFPENTTCKNCITRPCRKLFSGRIFPGKMIFLHRNEFLSLPCHRPNFAESESFATEAEALTDDIEVITEKVNVTNPRWEHAGEERKEESPDVAKVDDEVLLKVDVTGIPEGASVTFDVFDVTVDPPMRIGGGSGPNEGGTATGEWKVEDPSERGADLKLEFEGVAKSKASERCPIDIEVAAEFEFTLYIDPEDPTSYDDKVILKGIDSDYEQTKTIADDKIKGDDMLTVAFTECKKGDRYTLIHDDGQEQHIIIEETVYGG